MSSTHHRPDALVTLASVSLALLLSPAPAHVVQPNSRSAQIRMAGGFGAKSATKGGSRTKGKKGKPLAPPTKAAAAAAAPLPPPGAPSAVEKATLPEPEEGGNSMFMGGWTIDPAICDGLIRCFDASPESQLRGQVSMAGATCRW